MLLVILSVVVVIDCMVVGDGIVIGVDCFGYGSFDFVLLCVE